MSRQPLPRILVLLLAPVLTLALVGAAPPQVGHAAQRTVRAAAYSHLKTFLNQYRANGFDRVTNIGSLATFRRTLTSVKVKVDRKLKPIAKYDPKTHTISFSRDPRSLPSKQILDFGETAWHELSHAIEDDRGDFGILDTTNYAERNVEYMAQIVNTAFPVLRNMERLARRGASKATLARYWKMFTSRMKAAADDAVANGYPAKPATLASWFGFSANTNKIRAYYLSGKFLPGKAGANLRAAVRASTAAANWAGTWSTGWGTLRVTQNGSSVTGTYTHDQGKITATASGRTLTGRWSEAPSYAGPTDAGTLTFTMSADGNSFTGSWTYDGGGGGGWSGTRS